MTLTAENPPHALDWGQEPPPSGPPAQRHRLDRLREELGNPLLRNGHLLTLSSTITAVVGLGYWAAAAWRYEPADVGVNSLAISLMTFAASVAQFNLSNAMVRFVPTAGRHTTRLVASAYALSCVLAVSIGAALVVGAHLFAPGWHLQEDNSFAVMFVIGTLLYTLFVIQDGVLVGLHRTAIVPLENMIFAVVKLVLVIALASSMPRYGIFGSWSAAAALTVILVGIYLFGWAIPRHKEAGQDAVLPPRRQIARFVAFDYIGSICSIASITLLPVIVTRVLGPTQNAYFSIAWVIANAIHLFGSNMGISLVAETARNPTELGVSVRRILSHTMSLLIPGVAVLAALTPWLLGLFGGEYQTASDTLRLLLVAAIPNLVVTIAVSSARAQGRVVLLAFIQGSQLVLVLGCGWLLISRVGLEGAALSWLSTQFLLAGVLLMNRHLWLGSAEKGERSPGPPARAVMALAALAVRVLRLLDALQLRPLLDRVLAVLRFDARGSALLWSQVESVLREQPERWRGVQPKRVPTVSDVAVFVLSQQSGGPGGVEPIAVVKVADSPLGAQELRSKYSVLARLDSDPALYELREMLPKQLAFSDQPEATVLVETFTSGIDLTTVISRDQQSAESATIAALSAIRQLHLNSGRSRTVDERAFDIWVGPSLAALREMCSRMSPRLTPVIDSLETLLGRSVIGRPALVSWIHGDFTPGNIRVAEDTGQITGVIDWAGARPDRLAVLDCSLLVLCVSRLLERREFGDIVARRLRTGGFTAWERRCLSFCADSPDSHCEGISEPALLLLTWLHQIGESIRKCLRFREDSIWWLSNVAPVLSLLQHDPTLLESPVQACEPASPQRISGVVDQETVTVAVVICAYTEQRWSDIVAAIDSVRKQNRPADELCLVIDHNPVLQQRCRAAFPDVRVVHNRYQQGLSGARNTGVRQSTCDIIAFLDDDATADPDWLATLLSGYADAAVLGVGGKVDPDWHGGRPRWFPPEFDWVVGCSYRGLPMQRSEIRNFIGANMSLRRSAILEAGGFSADLGRVGSLPTGCEETELCIRVQHQNPGGRLVYEPAAKVNHHVPGHRAKWSYFRSRCYSEGVSKATMASLVDPARALSTERSYLRTTIPQAILRNARRCLTRPSDALAGTFALLIGVVATGYGYLVGRLRSVAQPAGVGFRRFGGVYSLALAAALSLWGWSLSGIRLDLIGDYGLVPLLPVAYWSAVTLVLVGYSALMWTGASRPVLQSCYLIALVAFLHATACVLYPTLRYSWAWKHVGVIDFFMRHEGIDASIRELSVYQRWPAFFTFNATIAESAGLESSLGYAPWAPFFFGVVMLGPIYLIFRALTDDQRIIWTGLVIYVLGNWVGQDYFAPQPTAFFFYLTIVAICLSSFKPRKRKLLQASTGEPVSRSYVLVCVALIAAIAPTHQLSPLMLIVGMLALTVCRYRVGVLLLAAVVLTLGWDLLFAWPWISENLASITSSIGSGGRNAGSGFVNLSNVTQSQKVVAQIDRALSAAVGLLAIIGFIRMFRTNRTWIPALLAAAPISVMFTNDYGGEMIFRVYLFALPFLAFYAAAAFFPSRSCSPRWPTRAALAAFTLMLAPGFIVAYFGKESANYFSRDEFAVSAYVFGTAPPGSLIIGATSDFPWAYMNYEHYDYMRFGVLEPEDRVAIMNNPVSRFEDMMTAYHHSYLVITRSQIAQVEMLGALPAGAIEQIVAELAASPEFRVIFKNSAGLVISFAHPQPGVWE